VTRAGTEQTTSPVLPPGSGGGTQSEGDLGEAPEASESIGTWEQFPVCSPALEAKMITCEVPENYGA
jgi:hypothetical protein